LWQLRGRAVTLPAADLALDDGYAVLGHLTVRAVEAGDEIVGWKVGRLPSADREGAPFVFAAPVFRSGLTQRLGGRGPIARAEVEFVAELGDKLDVRSWYLGVEIIANHDPCWRITPATAVADWVASLRGAWPALSGAGIRPAPADDDLCRRTARAG
jgi:hypothetical protein